LRRLEATSTSTSPSPRNFHRLIIYWSTAPHREALYDAGMRFSIKWPLAVMAYVALAATAATIVGQNGLILADIVWLITILAVCYALIVACGATGKRRQMALGVAVVSAAYVVCLNLAPDRVPTSWMLNAAGYDVTSNGDILQRTIFMGIRPRQSVSYPTAAPNRRALLTTVNATGTMAAGLIGLGLGALAYSRGQRDQSASD
jgi:hypothetical protein